MNYLLDTQIFLWWISRDLHLEKGLQSIIEDPSHQIMLSVVSAWEISIKNSARKLPLKSSLEETFAEPGMEMLPITFNHVLKLHQLPLIHKDPFDRILVAQAKVEKLTLITSDTKIWKYDVPLLKVK